MRQFVSPPPKSISLSLAAMLYALFFLLTPAVFALPSLRRAAITDFDKSPIDISFPPSRGFSAGTADDAPCGGMPLGQRTSYPLSGGDIALTQSTDATSVNILWTSDPDPKRFHSFNSYTNSIADIGPGHYCSKAPDFGALGLQAGTNATLLVIYELDGGNQFHYNCADLTLVETASFSTNAEYVCGNYTGTLQVSSSDDSLHLTASDSSESSGSHGTTDSEEGSTQSSTGISSSGLSAAEGGGIGAGVTLAVMASAIGVAAWLGYVKFGKSKRGTATGSETASTSSAGNMKERQ